VYCLLSTETQYAHVRKLSTQIAFIQEPGRCISVLDSAGADVCCHGCSHLGERDFIIEFREFIIKLKDFITGLGELIMKLRDFIIELRDLIIEFKDSIFELRDFISEIEGF
jgi:hypothetical protein